MTKVKTHLLSIILQLSLLSCYYPQNMAIILAGKSQRMALKILRKKTMGGLTVSDHDQAVTMPPNHDEHVSVVSVQPAKRLTLDNWWQAPPANKWARGALELEVIPEFILEVKILRPTTLPAVQKFVTSLSGRYRLGTLPLLGFAPRDFFNPNSPYYLPRTVSPAFEVAYLLQGRILVRPYTNPLLPGHRILYYN